MKTDNVYQQVIFSSKLRTKLKRFEKLRSEIKVDKRFPDKSAAERRITILSSGSASSTGITQAKYTFTFLKLNTR